MGIKIKIDANLKQRVYSFLDDFPKSTINDLARVFCRRGCKREDLVQITLVWRQETSEQLTFDKVHNEKSELVIRENQIVPKDYKKPSQNRICTTCGQKYVRDDLKRVEVCPHCQIPRQIKLGFYGSDFCRMCIPARTPKNRYIMRKSGGTILNMQAGRAPKVEHGKVVYDKEGFLVYEDLPLPAGIIPRLIILYISGCYIKTKNREIPIGKSIYEFINLIGRKKGGSTYKNITNQLNRLIRSQIGFFKETNTGTEELLPKALTDKITMWWDIEEGEKNLVPSKIILSDPLLEIIRTSVPLDLNIVHELGSNVLAFDIYTWMTARHYNLTSPSKVTWQSLHDQFGVNYKRLRQFKPEFKKAFDLVKSYYPHNSKIAENGVLLLPSRTDIDPKLLSDNKKKFLFNFMKLG